MKTCVSYSHHFECKNDDRLPVLRLNKLERSNKTPIHHFVCKFEKNVGTIKNIPKSRFVWVVGIVLNTKVIRFSH